MILSVLIYAIFPFGVSLWYEQTGLWNPNFDYTEDGFPIGFVSFAIPFTWWILCWVVLTIATNAECMPAQLKALRKAFNEATNRYKFYAADAIGEVKSTFEKDLLKRASVYLEACKKTTSEEVALCALADIAKELSQPELHEAVVKRLEEIDQERPRLNKILQQR